MKTWQVRRPARRRRERDEDRRAPSWCTRPSTVHEHPGGGARRRREGAARGRSSVTRQRLRRQRRGGGAGRARARDAGDEDRGRLGRQGEDDRPGADRVLHANPRHDGDGRVRRFPALLREREPARPGDEPVDARRQEARARAGASSAGCSRRTTGPTAPSSGRSSARAAWARAATPGVGDATTTIAMFCRRQKGRHFVL